jgi:ribosomal protein S18 acetylase RimI-like enzyme
MIMHCDPPIPSKKPDHLFAQTIQMKDGDRLIGQASWSAAAPSQGIVQILELWIDPKTRRAGHGKRLMRTLLEQARLLHKLRDEPLRRLWIGVGHKTQIIGRSFLTSEGFHHISTTGGLMQDEDQLIYVKSLD